MSHAEGSSVVPQPDNPRIDTRPFGLVRAIDTDPCQPSPLNGKSDRAGYDRVIFDTGIILYVPRRIFITLELHS